MMMDSRKLLRRRGWQDIVLDLDPDHHPVLRHDWHAACCCCSWWWCWCCWLWYLLVTEHGGLVGVRVVVNVYSMEIPIHHHHHHYYYYYFPIEGWVTEN